MSDEPSDIWDDAVTLEPSETKDVTILRDDYLQEVSTDYELIVNLIAITRDEARPTLLRLIRRLIDGIESHTE